MTDTTQTPEYRENLAQIAEALMETTARNCPGWHPADCPSEIVVDLVNERDELRAQLRDCEMSLKIFDEGHSSEYWERHSVQPSNE